LKGREGETVDGVDDDGHAGGEGGQSPDNSCFGGVRVDDMRFNPFQYFPQLEKCFQVFYWVNFSYQVVYGNEIFFFINFIGENAAGAGDEEGFEFGWVQVFVGMDGIDLGAAQFQFRDNMNHFNLFYFVHFVHVHPL
jgi:hypothetical protein